MTFPIKIILHPEAIPGVCFRCLAADLRDQLGQRTRAFFVDTGVEYDYEGRVYICNYCLAEMTTAALEFERGEDDRPNGIPDADESQTLIPFGTASESDAEPTQGRLAFDAPVIGLSV